MGRWSHAPSTVRWLLNLTLLVVAYFVILVEHQSIVSVWSSRVLELHQNLLQLIIVVSVLIYLHRCLLSKSCKWLSFGAICRSVFTGSREIVWIVCYWIHLHNFCIIKHSLLLLILVINVKVITNNMSFAK
jgi:hypothetical protein